MRLSSKLYPHENLVLAIPNLNWLEKILWKVTKYPKKVMVEALVIETNSHCVVKAQWLPNHSYSFTITGTRPSASNFWPFTNMDSLRHNT
jgi:hypothetical protein